jgi:hypothetical protein
LLISGFTVGTGRALWGHQIQLYPVTRYVQTQRLMVFWGGERGINFRIFHD